MKDIVNENNNSKAVNAGKEVINKEQVADSLKKAVKQAEEKATYRDYSGKIRYGDRKESKSDTPKQPKVFDKAVKQRLKNKQRNSVVKPKNVDTVVKIADKSDIVLPNNEKSVIKAENISQTVKGDIFSENKINTATEPKSTLNKSYKKKVKLLQERKKSAVIKDNSYTVPIKDFSVDGHIVNNSQESALSSTTSDYISKPVIVDNKPTAFEKVIHQKQMAMVKENINKSAEPITYRSDLTEDKVQANAEMVVTNRLPVPDDNAEVYSQDVECAKDYKRALKQHFGKKKSNTTLGDLSRDKLKSTVQTALKNSDDETLKSTEKVVLTTATAVDVLKSENIEKARRKTVYDKSKTAENVKNLNIRQEFKDNIATAISDMNGSTKKAINAVGKSAVATFREDIKEYGENDLSFKAVDNVITVVETTKDIKEGYNATINTANNLVNGTTSTVKAIRNAPQSIKNAKSSLLQTKQRYNAFKRLQTRQRINIIKSKGKQATKKVADAMLKSARGIVIKAAVFSLLYVVLIVAICGLVAGAIGSYIWDTSAVMDTTKIVKYISNLDYNRQRAWFRKGKTAVEIAQKNDNSSSNSYRYYYCIAKDVPMDPFFFHQSEENFNEHYGTANTLVTERVSSDGEQLKPTYKGFNEIYYSADEFLEENRWTTEDYRAALAYMQVKCENLGWLESHIGFVGENKLKEEARKLVEFTWDAPIVHKEMNSDGTCDYSADTSELSISYSHNKTHEYYYFGRKFSVKYLIDNDILKFSSDDDKQREQKERFNYTYKYGNYAVAALSFPLDLEEDETISSRISKHFGKQLILKYKPPTPSDKKTVYGTVSSKDGTHWANDLSASDGDVIKAPISGLCIAKQREGRGFEYVISTSYDGTNFKFDDYGYCVKMSCSGASYIRSGVPTLVTQGQALGLVGKNMGVNNTAPSSDNDTENEDLIADLLFPCATATTYHDIDGDYYEEYPPESEAHLHIELYSLPCDFTDENSVKENILAPELFFDYSSEESEETE